MAKDGKYLVAYDIEDDSERRRVSRVVAGFGLRVQKSVFECRLTRAGLGKLERKLLALELDPAGGCICIYRLSESAKRRQIGDCPTSLDDEQYAFVV